MSTHLTRSPSTPTDVESDTASKVGAAKSESNTTAFRRAMSQFATGITVVATRTSDDELIGLTVNSFNSVSLHPPLVLWSLSKHSRHLIAFRAAPRYTISVLNAGQEKISRLFAKRDSQRFAQVEHHFTPHGLPVISQACAWFECRQRSQYEEGDHIIFIGEVERCAADSAAPLVYFNSAYQALNLT